MRSIANTAPDIQGAKHHEVTTKLVDFNLFLPTEVKTMYTTEDLRTPKIFRTITIFNI